MSSWCCGWFNNAKKKRKSPKQQEQQVLWYRFVDAVCQRCRSLRKRLRTWRQRGGAAEAPSAKLKTDLPTPIHHPQPTIDHQSQRPTSVSGPEPVPATTTTAEWPVSRTLLSEWEGMHGSSSVAGPVATTARETAAAGPLQSTPKMQTTAAAAAIGDDRTVQQVQKIGSNTDMRMSGRPEGIHGSSNVDDSARSTTRTQQQNQQQDTTASGRELGVDVPRTESDDSLHFERQRRRSKSSRRKRRKQRTEKSETSQTTVPTQRDDGLYESFELPKPKPPEPPPPQPPPPKQIVASVTANASATSSNGKDWGDYDKRRVDYDAIYNSYNKADDDSVFSAKRGVIMHILSQMVFGMDMSRVALPAFILDRRSMLEMYAEFFAHPDEFISASKLDTAYERFLAVLKYYLNSFYPGHKFAAARKPYNPMLGETFRCRWTLPDSGRAERVRTANSRTNGKTQEGPFPDSSLDQVTFIAEQVSHHPPIAAFYAEHPGAGVSLTAHICTKTSFLGLSVAVSHIGGAVVKLHKFNEEYAFTYPKAYARSIVATPWIELGGKAIIRCDKTRYRAEINFLTKPMLHGSAHHIDGWIYRDQQQLMHLKGQWNGRIYARRKGSKGPYQLFSDVLQKPEVPKECVPLMQQEELESRKVWRHVTAALYERNEELATKAKQWIEQRQRDQQAKRAKCGVQWRTRHFERIGGAEAKPTDAWRYRESLELRSRNGWNGEQQRHNDD